MHIKISGNGQLRNIKHPGYKQQLNNRNKTPIYQIKM